MDLVGRMVDIFATYHAFKSKIIARKMVMNQDCLILESGTIVFIKHIVAIEVLDGPGSSDLEDK